MVLHPVAFPLCAYPSFADRFMYRQRLITKRLGCRIWVEFSSAGRIVVVGLIGK